MACEIKVFSSNYKDYLEKTFHAAQNKFCYSL